MDTFLSGRGPRSAATPTFTIVKCYHADHGVSEATMLWALEQEIGANVAQIARGFFLLTLTLPDGHADLRNSLYGPASGDEPVDESRVHYRRRTPDRPESRMVSEPARPTRLLTIIGTIDEDGVTVYTAHGGPAAEREPGDPTLTAGTPEHDAAVAFWAQHALAQ